MRHLERGLGALLNLTRRDARRQLAQHEPLCRDVDHGQIGDDAVHHGASGERRRLLVVDDNSAVRRLLCRLVESWGYACDEAPNGRIALERLGAADIALILTDYDMPGGNGIELIQAVTHLDDGHAATPIIMVTGSATDDVCEDALSAGAQAVFGKPFVPALLHTAIDLFAEPSPFQAPA